MELNQSTLLMFVQTHQLKGSFREELMRIIKAHPGQSLVALQLSDDRTGKQVLFASNKYRVAISEDIIGELKGLNVETRVLDYQVPDDVHNNELK